MVSKVLERDSLASLIGSFASWLMTDAVRSAFTKLAEFFRWLSQNVSWSWGVLVSSGTLAASVGIETLFSGVSLISPRFANAGRAGVLHVRAWWVELRAARERALLQGEVARLRTRVEELSEKNASGSNTIRALTTSSSSTEEQLRSMTKEKEALLLKTKRLTEERDLALQELRLKPHHEALTLAINAVAAGSTNSQDKQHQYFDLQRAAIACQLQYNAEAQKVIDRLPGESPEKTLLCGWRDLARRHMEVADAAINAAIFQAKVEEPLAIIFAPSTEPLPQIGREEALKLIFPNGPPNNQSY